MAMGEREDGEEVARRVSRLGRWGVELGVEMSV